MPGWVETSISTLRENTMLEVKQAQVRACPLTIDEEKKLEPISRENVMRIARPKKRRLFQWLSGPFTRIRVVHTSGEGCRSKTKPVSWAVKGSKASVIRAVSTEGQYAGH